MAGNFQKAAGMAAALILFVVSTLHVAAQGGLQTINPPGGGKIVYGQVAGQSTEAGAMGQVLRSLHNSLGEKPQVGKLFQVRGTDSYAVFFNVARHDQGPGKPALKVAGMLIAVKVSGGHVEAALVSDDAARFPKTLGPMTKSLMSVWHPLGSGASAPSAGGAHAAAGAPAAQLHRVVLQDGSASVSLPDDWHLSPNQSAMGTIVANGPNGEGASLGTAFNATDTNNPNAQRTMQIVRNGGLRNTVYANAFYYPYGGDLSRAFVDFVQHVRQKSGLSPLQINISSATPVAAGPRTRCAHMTGSADFGDGKGQRELDVLFCENPPGPASGGYLALAYSTSVPVALAAKERATLAAIMQSFNVNRQVLNSQIGQIAGPAIAQIHAIGEAAARQADAAHQREDIQRQSVEQHWDSNDRRSQEFENYQLGYAVVSDFGNNAHGTLWADDAAALVKSNPDRFQYVNVPDYWKGIDY